MCSIIGVGERLHTFIFDRTFVKLAGNKDRHKISNFQFWARLDSSLWSYLPLSDKKFSLKMSCQQDTIVTFDLIIIKLADKQRRHKLSDTLKFWLDRTIHFRVACPCVPKTSYLTWGKLCEHDSAFIFNLIFL